MTKRACFVAAMLAAAIIVLLPRAALAYPWMIRHEYTGCTACHADPSGGGLLTEYGRVQSVTLLSSRYNAGADEEPGRVKDFLLGVVPTPDRVLLGGWVRNGYLWTFANGSLVDHRFLQMRADLAAQVKVSSLRASGSIGFASADSPALSRQAWVTRNNDGPNLVSREHWVGVDLADDTVLVRGGRLNLPFGLRNIEHTTWVRSETRTDTNQHQQHGVALAWTRESLRGEVMGILGNFQLGPDAYRERGYAGYIEFAFAPRYALGVSSLVTHAAADLSLRRPTTRQAHGLFARAAPWKRLALLAEADVLVRSTNGVGTSGGFTGLLQADYEAVQGVHLLATGETLKFGDEPAGFGGWLSAWWFIYAHVDARIDLIERKVGSSPASTSLLVQLHLYL